MKRSVSDSTVTQTRIITEAHASDLPSALATPSPAPRAPASQAPPSRAPADQAPPSRAPAGQAPAGETPPGKTPPRQAPAGQTAGRRAVPPGYSRAALVLILVASFMVVLDFSIVNVALPSIQRELGFAASAAQWV